MRYLHDPQFKRAPDLIAERRARFESFNQFVTAHNGWVVSVPGSSMVVVECLPTSNLANVLARLGHGLAPEPDGERILAHAVQQDGVEIGSAGGIAATRRYRLALPK